MSLVKLIPEFRAKVEELIQKCGDLDVPMRVTDSLRTPAGQARIWRRTRTTAEINTAILELEAKGAPFLAFVLEEVGPQALEDGETLGNHLTKVLPGNGWHQWGEAVDCAWFPAGVYEPSANKLVNGVNGYRVYASQAEVLGLTAGGHWPTFKDWPHVQFRSADNPITTGMSWPDIDTAMKAKFGADPLK